MLSFVSRLKVRVVGCDSQRADTPKSCCGVPALPLVTPYKFTNRPARQAIYDGLSGLYSVITTSSTIGLFVLRCFPLPGLAFAVLTTISGISEFLINRFKGFSHVRFHGEHLTSSRLTVCIRGISVSRHSAESKPGEHRRFY